MFHIDQSATIFYIQHLQEMVFYLSVILIINISLCDYKSELSESNIDMIKLLQCNIYKMCFVFIVFL